MTKARAQWQELLGTNGIRKDRGGLELFPGRVEVPAYLTGTCGTETRHVSYQDHAVQQASKAKKLDEDQIENLTDEMQKGFRAVFDVHSFAKDSSKALPAAADSSGIDSTPKKDFHALLGTLANGQDIEQQGSKSDPPGVDADGAAPPSAARPRTTDAFTLAQLRAAQLKEKRVALKLIAGCHTAVKQAAAEALTVMKLPSEQVAKHKLTETYFHDYEEDLQPNLLNTIIFFNAKYEFFLC